VPKRSAFKIVDVQRAPGFRKLGQGWRLSRGDCRARAERASERMSASVPPLRRFTRRYSSQRDEFHHPLASKSKSLCHWVRRQRSQQGQPGWGGFACLGGHLSFISLDGVFNARFRPKLVGRTSG